MAGSRSHAAALVVLTLAMVCARDVNIAADVEGASNGHGPTPAHIFEAEGGSTASAKEERPIALSWNPSSSSGDAHPSLSTPSFALALSAYRLSMSVWVEQKSSTLVPSGLRSERPSAGEAVAHFGAHAHFGAEGALA